MTSNDDFVSTAETAKARRTATLALHCTSWQKYWHIKARFHATVSFPYSSEHASTNRQVVTSELHGRVTESQTVEWKRAFTGTHQHNETDCACVDWTLLTDKHKTGATACNITTTTGTRRRKPEHPLSVSNWSVRCSIAVSNTARI